MNQCRHCGHDGDKHVEVVDDDNRLSFVCVHRLGEEARPWGEPLKSGIRRYFCACEDYEEEQIQVI